MTPTTALLWKEWREVRWFVWVGLGVFLGLPLIGAAQAYWLMNQRNVPVLAFPWVIGLGGVLAVFIAVGITCQDLNDRLLTFWQSRPISTGPWILTKYLTGLMALLVVCTVPLMVEAATEHRMDSGFAAILLWHPFLLATLYSIAFVFGVLVRRMAHAAMLSLAGALLVYFLPYVLPPLNWLSFPLLVERSSYRNDIAPQDFAFAGGMLAICLAGLALAWLALRRDWRIEPDRKLIYWSVGLSMLLLLSTAAFQLGTDLPCLQQVAFPDNTFVNRFIGDGKRGVVWVRRGRSAATAVCSFEVSPSGLRIGPDVLSPSFSVPPAWTARHPQYAYVLDATVTDRSPSPIPNGAEILDVHFRLLTLNLRGEHSGPSIAHWLDLGSRQSLRAASWGAWVYASGDRLYALIGDRLAVLSLETPDAPRLLSSNPQAASGLVWNELPEKKPLNVTVWLPQLPGLSPRERLQATPIRGSTALDGDILVQATASQLITYRLESLSERSATYELIGDYAFTPLERMFRRGTLGISAGNGMVYLTSYMSTTCALSVYSIRDPAHPRRLGHFAAPDRSPLYTFPLPDGRVLAGGGTLYLLGPPRSR